MTDNPPGARRAIAVDDAARMAHSVFMVGSLPSVASRESSLVWRNAAFDSFLMHARILARFLVVCPSASVIGLSITDLGGSAPPAGPRSARVRAICRVADLHLDGLPVTSDEDQDVVDLSGYSRAELSKRAAQDLLGLVQDALATLPDDHAERESLRFAYNRAMAALGELDGGAT